MKLVVDANVLFSALIKNGITRELMINDELILYSPEYILEEFINHIDEITDKAHSNTSKLQAKIKELIGLSRLHIVSLSDINPYIKKAREISPDPQDALYFATALNINCPIWSNDKNMKKQPIVQVFSTADLLKLSNYSIVHYKSNCNRTR